MSAAPRRSFFAPEVVQTSAMDCGPAALKCLLEGFGVSVSYGRLREACQTDVDGTSIDTLEDLARRLGLDAEQVMVPPDLVTLPESDTLPAIAVVRLPSGFTHFVVVWRRLGPLVQIMDPSLGRRWIRAKRFERDLFVHTLPVPADAYEEWIRSKESLRALCARLGHLGAANEVSPALGQALGTAGWKSLAALDAATRMVAAVVAARGLRRGAEAARAIRALHTSALAEGEGIIPAPYWTARHTVTSEAEAPTSSHVAMRGAVLVRVAGRSQSGAEPALSPELDAALREPPARPFREIVRLATDEGVLGLGGVGLLVGALFVAAVAAVVEVALLRGLFTMGRELGVVQQRWGAVGALLAFLVMIVALELPVTSLTFRLGRRLEARLRVAFLRKLPRLGDGYLRSRPASDMAERSHGAHRLRALPEISAQALRVFAQLVVTTAGLVLLSPAGALLALASGGLALLLPLVAQPALRERDLRVRSHTGALGRFVLDALVGLVPIRAHAAERAVAREHEALLVEWEKSGRALVRVVVAADIAQTLVGYSLAAALVLRYVARGGEPTGALLLAYWALDVPVLGQQFGSLLRQVAAHRNTALRLLEPLGAVENARGGETSSSVVRTPARTGVGIAIEGVDVVAGGHPLLRGVDLSIAPAEHIAIVGASGAGKSSLLGLLLGWHRPSAGRVRVDGALLDATQWAPLRARTAWVDPAVQLWNRSLLDNVLYGAQGDPSATLALVLEAAEVHAILEKLPNGFQTLLGDSGGLLSGGEGQRVRLARAMLRRDADLVLLDESFRGLDRACRRRLLVRTRHWWRHATLLFVTHDMEAAATFGRVVVIEDGRVVEDGAPDRLLADSTSRYRALVDAERDVWRDPGWRSLRLESGQLVEEERRLEAIGG